MPKLYKSWKYTRFMMSSLRCFLTVSYLWLMIHAAAVVPVVNEHSKWFFWVQQVKLWVTYSSLLTFDLQTQGYILFAMLLVLIRFFQCSHCHFCNRNEEMRNVVKVPFDKRMFIYFGPYLLLFFICWTASMYSIGLDLVRITEYITSPQRDCTLCKLGMTVLFKLLVFVNALVRCIRCSVILRVLSAEPAAGQRNRHNLGDHFNLLFLY